MTRNRISLLLILLGIIIAMTGIRIWGVDGFFLTFLGSFMFICGVFGIKI